MHLNTNFAASKTMLTLPTFQNIDSFMVDRVDNEFDMLNQDSISIRDSNPSGKTQMHVSRFFTSKRDDSVSYNPEPLPQPQNEWQIVALSFSFLIIAFVRVGAKHFFRNLYSGLISRPIFKQLLRDGELIPQIGKFPLLVSFLLIITIFIFQVDSRFPFVIFNKSNSIIFNGLIVFTLLGIYEISRFLIMQVLGFIFKIKWIVREFITNNIFFNTLSTLLVMPLLVVSIYARTDIIIIVGAALLVILFIIRMIRAILISSELSSFSGYQIFLYLCALEILPVFVIIKLLTGYISEI